MSNRYKALTVVLDQDYRDDDAESIINAIRMVKGVQNVSPVETEPLDFVAKNRVGREVSDKLYAIIKDLAGMH